MFWASTGYWPAGGMAPLRSALPGTSQYLRYPIHAGFTSPVPTAKEVLKELDLLRDELSEVPETEPDRIAVIRRKIEKLLQDLPNALGENLH